MSDERQLTEVTDFADVLLPIDHYGAPVVVGGHAVNLWASYFLSAGDSILSEDRSDVKHVAMMIRCNRAFILELLHGAKQSHVTQRQVVNVLEELRGIVTGPMSLRASAQWGFDFSAVWPINELAGCEMEKIEKFVQMRLRA